MTILYYPQFALRFIWFLVLVLSLVGNPRGDDSRRASGLELDACQFDIGGKTYDLCPLFRHLPQSLIVDVPSTEDGVARSYRWGTRNSDLYSRLYCPRETWLCLIETYPGYSVEIPVIGTKASASVSSADNDGLIVRLTSGSSKDPLYAELRLECDPQADPSSRPRFISASRGIHSFSWTLRHACGNSIRALDVTASTKATSSQLETITTSQPAETPNDELVDPTEHNPRQIAAWIVLVSGTVVLGAGIVLSRYPKGQNQGWTSPLPSFPHVHVPTWKRKFRDSDDIMLVRWVDEEMGVGVDDGDEDVMVNGTDATDEYLPLRRDLDRKGYGSAKLW